MLLKASLPPAVATGAAIAVQALAFGAVHAYTPSAVYVVTAGVVGLVFGASFAATGNLLVPIVMHFVTDLVTFGVVHAQIAARGEEAARAELGSADSPIAAALRRLFGGEQREDVLPLPRSPGADGAGEEQEGQ